MFLSRFWTRCHLLAWAPGRRARSRSRSSPRLCVEVLESRLSPAVHTWTGLSPSGTIWSDPFNWSGGPPTSSTETDVELVFPAGASQLNNTNNLGGVGIFMTVNKITISGAGYVLNGQPILLVGGGSIASNGTGTNTINLDGFDLTNTNNGGFIDVAAGGVLVVNADISGPASKPLVKQGAGRLELAGSNTTYQGL